MPAEAPTIATALKELGYVTGQFGKNHLGDRNEYLPTLHGFDEFYGYLYHLDAMEDPAHPNYPQQLLDKIGPRNMLHCFATATDDTSTHPRWGKVGKQTIKDEGTLYPDRMETVDDEIRDKMFAFLDKAVKDGKPFFVWHNPTRMHVVTHLSDKYQKMRTAENGWSVYEAGMAQLDDLVGDVMKKLDSLGVADNTIVVFTTDNGAENFTWPDGGQTPFAGGKGSVLEGGFRVPCVLKWPGVVQPGKVENGLMSGLDWFPTFVAAAGNDKIVDQLKAGATLNGTKFKSHLDGYDQRDFLAGKSPSKRREIFYFAEAVLGAVRINDYKYRFIDQPGGWLRWHGEAGLAVPGQHPARSVRAHEHRSIHGSCRLVEVRVLAVRVRAGGRREVRRELHRLPAAAEARELQPRSGQGAGPRRRVALGRLTIALRPHGNREKLVSWGLPYVVLYSRVSSQPVAVEVAVAEEAVTTTA